MKKNFYLLLAFGLTYFATTGSAQNLPFYLPADGLVGWWPFNGNANDESGNGNDGVVNGATLAEDRFGNLNSCFFFDGTNDNISTSPELPIGSSPRTIQTWIKSTATTSVYPGIMCAIGYGSNNAGLVIFPHHINLPQGNGYFESGSGNNQIFTESPVNNGTWHQIVTTYGGPGTRVKLYLDGVIQDSTAALTLNTASSILQIGNAAWANVPFNGNIDDVSIWNRELNPQEIQGLYIGCSIATTTIAGELAPFTFTENTYSCNNNAGNTYEWTVTNGVITAGQGTSNVTVLWSEEGPGTLSVVETNAEGCSGNPATIEVQVQCNLSATTISGPLGPNELTPTTYNIDGNSASTYTWTITNGVITAGQGTTSITVLWAATGLGTLSVQETTAANCSGDLITIDVVVIPTAIAEEHNHAFAVYPNPAGSFLNVQLPANTTGCAYSVYTMNGQSAASGRINANPSRIEVNMLSAGKYILHLDGLGAQIITIER